MTYGSLLARGIAFMLDFIFLCAFFFPITYMVKGVWIMSPEDHLWVIFDPLCGFFLIIIFTYFIVLEWLFGFTVGKLVLGLRVMSNEGKGITLKQSIVRNLARLIDGLPFFNLLGILSIIKSPLNKRVGDKLAGTVVLYLSRY